MIAGTDNINRNHHKNDCKRDLTTLFGEVKVKRLGYGQRSVNSLFPLDAELNLPLDQYSHGLRRLVAENASQCSFDESINSVKQNTGGKVPKRQAEELVAKVAVDFEAFYANRQSTPVEDPANNLLVMSTDGKGITMRKEGLREATRKAAEKDKKKGRTRLSPGEKNNRKRMATVATIYDIEKHIRTPESIMEHQEKSTTKKPIPLDKRVWASLVREAKDVINEMFQEALHRDINNNRDWVITVDGQPQQLKNILSCIKRHKITNITVVLDIIHVIEYLWQAAHSFKFSSLEAKESWVRKRILLILQGKVSDVAAGIRRSATLRKLTAQARKTVDTCVNYFLKCAHMMKYDEYLANGFPIATGVIEGACRHLIKDRMDITGARWGLKTAEAILKLRSLRSSGDFDAYWQFHKTKELQRNHLALYKNFPLRKTA